MSAIGDVVHTLPIVSSIRAAVPDATITWLIHPVPHDLVRHHPAVDEFIVVERRPFLRGLLDLRRATRGRDFDLVLLPQTALKASLAAALLRSPRKVGFDRPRAPELSWLVSSEPIAAAPRAHHQDEALEFVDHLGIPRHLDWGLEPTPEERARYASLLPPFDGPTIALVTATSRPQKDWPAERFAHLADEVAGTFGARTIIVGGRSPAELAAAATIAALARRPPLDLGAWDLRRLVFLLSSADLVVSPDSGPLHIAVALGTPTVALMGYTNPKRVGPYRFRDLMVDGYGEPGEEYSPEDGYRPGRMARIPVATVIERIAAGLDRAGA